MPEKDKLVSFFSFFVINTGKDLVCWCLQLWRCTEIPVCSVCTCVQVWRQKAQYLQHKQNKAEATTVKHKSASESKSKGIFDCKDHYLSSSCHFLLLLSFNPVFPWQLQEQEQGWCHRTERPVQCPCPLHESQMWIPLMQQLTFSSWGSPCLWLGIGYRRQR